MKSLLPIVAILSFGISSYSSDSSFIKNFDPSEPAYSIVEEALSNKAEEYRSLGDVEVAKIKNQNIDSVEQCVEDLKYKTKWRGKFLKAVQSELIPKMRKAIDVTSEISESIKRDDIRSKMENIIATAESLKTLGWSKPINTFENTLNNKLENDIFRRATGYYYKYEIRERLDLDSNRSNSLRTNIDINFNMEVCISFESMRLENPNFPGQNSSFTFRNFCFERSLIEPVEIPEDLTDHVMGQFLDLGPEPNFSKIEYITYDNACINKEAALRELKRRFSN